MSDRVFVDSFAWIAMINRRDNYYRFSIDLLDELLKQRTNFVTTNYILIETINALSKAAHRKGQGGR
jgi:predicted nucleic acid-binding protein